MNKELKDKWLTELRSGKYRQIRNTFRRHSYFRGTGYCATGLLIKIMEEDDAPWGTGMHSLELLKIVRMNDKERLSFPAIADYIEANL